MVPADIAERVERARALMRNCGLCERRCHVDRLAGEVGSCGLGEEAYIFNELLHWGEELELVPSHAVYMSGCSFRCIFCMSGEHILKDNVRKTGRLLEPEDFASVVAARRAAGATNVNFVGGEPSVNLLAILELLQQCPKDTCVAWNSNMFYTREQADLLAGIVDIYMADWKFGNDGCAKKLAGVDGYVECVERNLTAAVASGARVIVRYLLMPNHDACCLEPIVDRLSTNFSGVPISLLDPYVPLFRAHKVAGMDRPSTREQAQRAKELIENRGMELLQ